MMIIIMIKQRYSECPETSNQHFIFSLIGITISVSKSRQHDSFTVSDSSIFLLVNFSISYTYLFSVSVTVQLPESTLRVATPIVVFQVH